MGLCVHCRGRVGEIGRRCTQCARPLDARRLPDGYRCARCHRHPPPWDRLLAPFLYEPPLDEVVRHLKFSGLTYLGAHAAEGIHRSFGEALTTVDVVTPVPLYWRRRIARGYNQAAEISRPLAERIARPHRLLLRRSRSTRRQATLPRDERLSNPAGAFAPRQRERIAGLNVLLVDDVVTTGATVGAAARALRDAGAESVTVAALARTSPPEAGERRFWQGS